MTKRPNWSGTTVRNFIKCCGMGSAIAAAAILAMLGGVQTSAQVWRFSKNSHKPNEQQQTPPQRIASFTDEQFQRTLDRAIELTSKRYLVANSHSPWQIFHSILALREKTLLRLGTGKVNAIEWLSTTEPKFDNEPWMLLTKHGAKFHPYTKKYYFEGHPGQFLALLTHSNLPLDHQFKVQGKTMTLDDFIKNAMQEVNNREEVTWILWALQHHLPSDAAWVNQAGESWSIERLVEMETAAQVVGAPCGGNHRLFALTRARDKYLQNGGRLRGVWLQADLKIKQHIEIARSLQNIDGSFSSKSYAGPMHTSDVNERFNTTGHTMEFLSVALPKDRLNEQWVKNAVWTLSSELIQHQNTQIDGGPLFHSLDALILYRDRIRPNSTNPDSADPSAQPAPQIANPKPDTPLSNKLNKGPAPLSIAESPKQLIDAAQESRRKQGIELPPDSSNIANQRIVDAKPDSSKAAGLPSRPVTSSRSGTAATAPAPLNSEMLPPLRDIAAPIKTSEKKIPISRSGDRNKATASPPALLPESFARPLLQTEKKADDSNQNAPSDCSTPSELQWRATSPDRIAGTPAFELPVIEMNDEPVSAMEPTND